MIKIRKGDEVKVITGKDAGKIGKVTHVNIKDNKAAVESVNVVSRHTKPSQQSQGGIIKRSAPISLSNIMIVSKDKVPERIGFKRLKNGKKVRVCKKSLETLS